MKIKQIKIYLILNLILIFCLSTNIIAQNVKIKGKVTDEDGMPIPSVSIVEKGTKRGVNTDIDGNYTFSAAPNASLVFSYLGYKSVTVALNGRTELNVKMETTSKQLEDVVIVAYGKQKAITVSGALSSIGSEQLQRSPSVNVANTLAGQITGVSTVQNSGRPGADDPRIFVRGIASLTEDRSQPLYIVDGVERPFTSLDADEIQTISVLKDASATAVYGVRGANGVIIVTTKRGATGKASITASYSQGIVQPTQLLDFTDSYTYGQEFNERELNDDPRKTAANIRFNIEPLRAFLTNSDPIMYPNTDWLDYILKPTTTQSRANVSVSGGTEKVKYFTSIGVVDQGGLFKPLEAGYNFDFNFTRYNFRTNLDIEATKTTKVSFTVGSQIGVRNEPIPKSDINELFRLIYWSAPFSSPGLVDGKYVLTDAFYIRDARNDGLDAYYGRGFRNEVQNRLNFDIEVSQQLNFIKGLKFGAKISNNTTYVKTKNRGAAAIRYTVRYLKDVANYQLKPEDNPFELVYLPSGSPRDLDYSEGEGTDRNYYVESSLNYNRKFGNHNVGGLFLYNQQKNFYPKESNGTNSPNFEIPRGIVGIAARATYDYKSKYSLDINMGYNGSENFARENRFGLFPAVSSSWVISKESFMKSLPVISLLKLRGSIGLVGNDRIGGGRFLYLADSFDPSSGGYNFGFQNGIANLVGAVDNRLANPDVTWEKATKINLGLDLKLFKDNLGIVLDVFKERRKDILIINRGTLPSVFGINSIAPALNLGVVENKGFELEINWKQKLSEKLSFLLNVNMTYAKNTIINQDEVQRNQPYQRRTGRSVGQPFGRHFDRIFTEADLGRTDIPNHNFNLQPGDLIYKDLDGNGIIDKEDEAPIGYPDYPTLNGGINLSLNYGNFDINFSFAGATQTSRLLEESFKTPFGTGGRGLLQYLADGAYTPETADTATLPRNSANATNNNYFNSDFWIRDASYLRLKVLEFGYKLNSKWLKKIGVSGLRLFSNGNNLFTISKLKITDPETRTNSFPQYPLTKIYNFGLKFNFL